MFDYLKQGEITSQDVEKSIKELPLPEKVKAIAIYKRYKEIKKIEKEMEQAVRAIEKKYLKLDEPVLNNISDIAGGRRHIQAEELKDLPKYLTEEEVKLATAPQNLQAKKIEGYWAKCLTSAPLIKQSLGKEDNELLRAIQNIHVVDEEGSDNFTIVFTLGENNIVKNKDITIKFYLDKDSVPVKAQSSTLEWAGKNLTMKEIKKKQKNKKTGQQRVVTKQVKAKSFFNFFTSIDVSNSNPLQEGEEQAKLREELEQNFEVAGVIVDQVLPYSLEYYLGVQHEGDDEFGGNQDENEGEDSDEQQGEKKNKKQKSKSKSKGKDQKEPKPAAQKPECKNQ